MFSTPAERHIFLLGYFEVLCPWPPRVPMPKDYHWPVKSEYHYYLGGRAAALFTWLPIILEMIKLIKEALL